MKKQEPYQEMVENTMFILLGRMYETKTEKVLSEHFSSPISDEYQTCKVDAIHGLLNEEWIIGELMETWADDSIEVAHPRITQKGREWYQQQIIHNASKWKKLLKYLGKRLLGKTLDTYF